jgi:hypothetical protein
MGSAEPFNELGHARNMRCRSTVFQYVNVESPDALRLEHETMTFLSMSPATACVAYFAHGVKIGHWRPARYARLGMFMAIYSETATMKPM